MNPLMILHFNTILTPDYYILVDIPDLNSLIIFHTHTRSPIVNDGNQIGMVSNSCPTMKGAR